MPQLWVGRRERGGHWEKHGVQQRSSRSGKVKACRANPDGRVVPPGEAAKPAMLRPGTARGCLHGTV